MAEHEADVDVVADPDAPDAPDDPDIAEGPAVAAADPDRRAAVRALVLLGVALVAVLVGVVVLVLTDRNDAGDLTLDRTLEREGGTGADPGSPVPEVGPRVGADVDGYVASRHEALQDASGERLAVVSFDAYRTEDEARGMLGGAEVLALLVAAPGGEPRTVEGDLGEWAAAEAEAARAERDEILSLLPTVDVTDPFRGFYEAEVERLAALATALEAADAPLVFALVVRADASALRRLVDAEGVRLVDAAHGPDPAPSATYRGLRPEETQTAGTPDLRPE